MLEQLHIENFAIIEKTAIDFRPGLNILTGETGAGKSILIDAVGLVLGARADASAIRHGAGKADISATFRALPEVLKAQLLEDELEGDDSDEAVIRRVLREAGSKSFVNGATLPGARLKTLAAHLISIHGQNENHILLKSDEQRNRLDRYLANPALKQAVAAAWHDWQGKLAALKRFERDRAQHAERLELLRYQLEELNAISPKDSEFDEITSEHERLSAADELLESGARLQYLIDDAEPSLKSSLKQARHLAGQLAHLHEDFSPAAELLEQSAIYLDEALDTLNRQLARTEHDPETLARLDRRMSELHSLARKHGITPQQLGSHHAALQAQLEALENAEESGLELAKEVQQTESAYHTLATELHQLRQTHAPELAQDVENWIRRLGMAQAQFAIDIQPAATPGAHGEDDITFMLCANPGSKMQALAKVASGGELSRVSLAIEVACLDENPVPTVIFDEIDTGIGGEVADTVGHLLKTLSRSRQVLCITHLPQVAAYADHHYHIEKTSDAQSTKTRVLPLDDDARIIELARMLGSAKSDTSREHARAMREQALARS